jgi:hypothetical protein
MTTASSSRTARAASGLLLLLLAVGGCSCNATPTQPTPVVQAGQLLHFEQLVGTNWTGTATFGSGNDALPVRNTAFLWSSVCDIQGWCAAGYNAYGWGTLNDLRVRILGYNDDVSSGVFRRELYVGEPTQGAGRWDSAVLSADRQRLVITSSDFVWDQRRGVTLTLTRVPWPPDLACPAFRTCGSS